MRKIAILSHKNKEKWEMWKLYFNSFDIFFSPSSIPTRMSSRAAHKIKNREEIPLLEKKWCQFNFSSSESRMYVDDDDDEKQSLKRGKNNFMGSERLLKCFVGFVWLLVKVEMFIENKV